MTDPERIWLQNADDARATGDRLWCQDKVWPECEEQQEPTEYIRADLYASRISQQDAELERVRRELEETRRLSSVALDEAMFMREKAIANARERNAAEAKLAEARKTAFIEAAEIAQNITSAECREIISEEKWVDMTDDYGEHIGQMKQGACFRLNFRKGIAAALRAKAEETRT